MAQAEEVGNPDLILGNTSSTVLPSVTSGPLTDGKVVALHISFGWCSSLCCCFWFPMICFFAAANVLETCEEALGTYLRVFGLFAFLLVPTLQTIIVIAIWAKSRAGTKLAVEMLSNCVVLSLLVAGWIIWGQTSDVACYNPEGDHERMSINPRTLLFIWLVTVSTLLACLTCRVIFVMIGICGFARAEA